MRKYTTNISAILKDAYSRILPWLQIKEDLCFYGITDLSDQTAWKVELVRSLLSFLMHLFPLIFARKQKTTCGLDQYIT